MSEPRVKDKSLKDLEGFVGSWARWPDDFRDWKKKEDHSCVMYEKVYDWRERDMLNPSVVFLGLSPADPPPAPFCNYHCLGHSGDRALKKIIQDEELRNLVGAYMTDVLREKEQKGVDSKIDPKGDFMQQLNILDQDRYSVICLNQKALECYLGTLLSLQKAQIERLKDSKKKGEVDMVPAKLHQGGK
jgi:hypothetical protein